MRPCLPSRRRSRSEEHTSELQSRFDIVCRLLLEKKKNPAVLDQLFTFELGAAVDAPRACGVALLPGGLAAAIKHVVGAVVDQGGAHFFFNDTATTEIYTLSLHDALPI